MNDFPDLLPPPPRDLTPEQRDRLRARLPLEHDVARDRSWWIPGAAAAAAVVLVVGGAVGLSHLVGTGKTPHTASPAGPHVRTDPLPVDANGTACFTHAPRTVTMYEQVTPTRSVITTGFGFESSVGSVIDAASVAAKPVGQIASEGDFADPIPADVVRETGWNQRQPLAGAHLEAGATYTIFFRITIAAHARFVGPTISYFDDDGSRGVSVWKQTVSARTKCS